MSQYDNQDYYKVGGRSNGPAGTLDQFKRQVSRSRSVLGKDQERVLPGERPRAGIKRGGGGKGGKKASALDSLPRVVGTAGVSSRAKPPPTRTPEELEDMRRANQAMAEAEADVPVSGYAGEEAFPTPSEARTPERPPDTGRGAFRIPASEEFVERAAEEQEPEGPEVPAWLRPALRPFRPAMRLIGGAARVLDPPVRFTLDVMQRVGRLAQEPAPRQV
jgi:hypothetical protein